jgi:hypothetical protein
MCTVTQDMTAQTTEEIEERSTREGYPAFVAVADDPKRPTNEYVLVRTSVPQSLRVIHSFLGSLCLPTVFFLAECRLSILFTVYDPAIVLCLYCSQRQHDGRLWYVYVLLSQHNVTDRSKHWFFV